MSAVDFRQCGNRRNPLATFSKMEMQFSPFYFAIFAISGLQNTAAPEGGGFKKMQDDFLDRLNEKSKEIEQENTAN